MPRHDRHTPKPTRSERKRKRQTPSYRELNDDSTYKGYAHGKDGPSGRAY